MKYTLEAEISAYVFIDDSDFEILWKSAEKHYDSNVQNSTQEDGYLYRERKRRSGSDIPDYKREIKFSQRELDLAIKSLEFDSLSPEKTELKDKLTFILRDLISIKEEVNKTIQR